MLQHVPGRLSNAPFIPKSRTARPLSRRGSDKQPHRPNTSHPTVIKCSLYLLQHPSGHSTWYRMQSYAASIMHCVNKQLFSTRHCIRYSNTKLDYMQNALRQPATNSSLKGFPNEAPSKYTATIHPINKCFINVATISLNARAC